MFQKTHAAFSKYVCHPGLRPRQPGHGTHIHYKAQSLSLLTATRYVENRQRFHAKQSTFLMQNGNVFGAKRQRFWRKTATFLVQNSNGFGAKRQRFWCKTGNVLVPKWTQIREPLFGAELLELH